MPKFVYIDGRVLSEDTDKDTLRQQITDKLSDLISVSSVGIEEGDDEDGEACASDSDSD